MNEINYTTLYECLDEVEDPRSKKGCHFDWLYLLAIFCVGILSGHKGVRGIAQCGYYNRAELIAHLKPKRSKVPRASTLYRVLRSVRLSTLEACVARYTRQVDALDATIGAVETPAGEWLRGQSVDGKEVHGAGKQGAPLTLVSVVRHGSGTALAQAEVDKKTNEITVVPDLLAQLDLSGTVTTMDALLTQRTIAQQILDQKGHYLMAVKENQPTLFEAISYLFDHPPLPAADDEHLFYRSTNKGHGRLETRILESSTALNDYLDWPGVAQVIRRTRRWVDTKTGEVHSHVRFGVTSLDRHFALPQQLERFWRTHWTIENKLHYVRDVSMNEDASTIRTDNAPHAFAALRNAILALLRFEGWHFIPDAFRFFRYNLHNSLRILGALAS
ncbi:ISAs1 family transposase [Chloroflexi bacterium TSY]|nr:ISAs1 family transposase [Chloroflexi bacterium TSY]